MHPELFHIGPFPVYAWGFMLAVSVIIGIIGTQRWFVQAGLKKEWALDLVILVVLGGLVGARLLYILLYQRDLVLNNPMQLLTMQQMFSGLVWYGGVLGAIIPFFWYIRRKQMDFTAVVDIIAPFTALGYGLVRIGCFLAGCCYGKITAAPIGVVFPVVDQFARHPAQLYSAALNLLLAAFLLWLYPRRKFPGQIFSVYLIGYSVYRFIVEFFRESLLMVGSLTLGQAATLILLIIGIGLYWYLRRRHLNHFTLR